MKKNVLLLSLSLMLTCSIHHANAQSTLLQTLAGQWQFTASNNGKEVAPGIYSAGTDVISFTATAAADGKSLTCHSDCLYKSVSGNEYPGDWRILVEEKSDGQYRLGWVLDTTAPVSSREFSESKENYLENGFFYWGSGAEEHGYIYLLAENEDASAITGMTFWSPWSSASTEEYVLSNSENNAHKMYAVVSAAIPYVNSTGWIEIWSSPRISQASSAGIGTVTIDASATHSICDLQGRRLDNVPKRGLYIRDGKKYYRR